MPTWPSSGGESSAIYKDGDPVTVTLSSSETMTTPAGETWVVTINTSGGYLTVNGDKAMDSERQGEFVFTEGTELSMDSADAAITGWSV